MLEIENMYFDDIPLRVSDLTTGSIGMVIEDFFDDEQEQLIFEKGTIILKTEGASYVILSSSLQPVGTFYYTYNPIVEEVDATMKIYKR